jgi:hypothetical protein
MILRAIASETMLASVVSLRFLLGAFLHFPRWSRDRLGHLLAQSRPFQQRIQRRAERLPPAREAVLDLGRNPRVDGAPDDAVGFHLPELLDEHLLRDRRDRPFQIREAQHFASEEMEQDHQLPAALQDLESILDALGSVIRRQILALTSR